MKKVLAALCLLSSLPLFAVEDSQLSVLEDGWTQARFDLHKPDNEQKIDEMICIANMLVKSEPRNPRVLDWAATIYAEKARINNSLTALKYVKQAKTWYEEVIDSDPKGDDGHAYAFLGALYSKVPGWPLAFGDRDEAFHNLNEAVRINPTSIEYQTLLGEYFFDNKEYSYARIHLKKALDLPVDQHNPDRDQGRKKQAQNLLQQISDEE